MHPRTCHPEINLAERQKMNLTHITNTSDVARWAWAVGRLEMAAQPHRRAPLQMQRPRSPRSLPHRPEAFATSEGDERGEGALPPGVRAPNGKHDYDYEDWPERWRKMLTNGEIPTRRKHPTGQALPPITPPSPS